MARASGTRRARRLAIEVLPPFYQTWWFLAVAISAVAGLVWFSWQRRVAQLQRAQVAQQAFSRRLIESQEGERQRIAAELHDSLGQSLLVVKNRALLGLQSRPDEQAQTQLAEIGAGQELEPIGPRTRGTGLAASCLLSRDWPSETEPRHGAPLGGYVGRAIAGAERLAARRGLCADVPGVNTRRSRACASPHRNRCHPETAGALSRGCHEPTLGHRCDQRRGDALLFNVARRADATRRGQHPPPHVPSRRSCGRSPKTGSAVAHTLVRPCLVAFGAQLHRLAVRRIAMSLWCAVGIAGHVVRFVAGDFLDPDVPQTKRRLQASLTLCTIWLVVSV